MPYRNPQPLRHNHQVIDYVQQFAGETVTWRHYVSASAGIANAGFGSALYATERQITALLGKRPTMPEIPEFQTPAGQIAAGTFFSTTLEKLGRDDELVWNGEVYRIEADSVPSHIDGQFVTTLKRGGGG